MHNRLVAAVLTVALIPALSCQRSGGRMQSEQPQPQQSRVLLDVVQHSWNVDRDETLVFLRVYEDGRAEAHPLRTVDFRQLDYKRKRLSAEQLDELEKLLTASETANLGNSYVRDWGGHDFGYEWTVTLGPLHRSLSLVNYQPFLAKAQNRPYPIQLVKLGCVIWRIRIDVSGERLDKDFTRGCREWEL